jgi:hypothetical protein
MMLPLPQLIYGNVGEHILGGLMRYWRKGSGELTIIQSNCSILFVSFSRLASVQSI